MGVRLVCLLLGSDYDVVHRKPDTFCHMLDVIGFTDIKSVDSVCELKFSLICPLRVPLYVFHPT